jgi:hypothetical protein
MAYSDRKKQLLIFICALSFISLFAQDETPLKTLFVEAESYFLFEEYNEALPIYQRILREEPENYNVIYKIGICFLKDKFQKSKAIEYLERAVKNTNPDYKLETFKEKLAPYEANFYLGDAYRVNGRFEDALESYNYFLDNLDDDIYDRDLVKSRIKETTFAMQSVRNPRFFEAFNMGDNINSRFIEMNPILSGDGNTFAFTRKLQFYDGVFVSTKTNEGWSNPINLTPDFGLDGNSYTTSLSYDGTEMYVYRSDEYDGNIYVSRLVNGVWSVLRKLNDNINTKYWESHATISSDGNKLLFTSNRKGGYGGLDIYMSYKQSDGDWGPAQNLGSSINSLYNEDAPFFSEDEEYIYFCSQGHDNMGGYDIFRSQKQSDGSYGKPENIGYPLSTSFDDLFYFPIGSGDFVYYAMYEEGGYGLDDIYLLEVFSEIHPRSFTLKGELLFSDKIPDQIKQSIQIQIVNKLTDKIQSAQYLANTDGKFDVDIEQGQYEMIISGPGIDTISRAIDLPMNTNDSDLSITANIETNEDYDKLSKKDIEKLTPPKLETQFEEILLTDTNLAIITFEVDKKSTLLIDRYANGELIQADSFFVKEEEFVYQFEPLEGINRLEVLLRNKDGNIITKTITVNYQPEFEDSESIAEESIFKNNAAAEYLFNNASDSLRIHLSNLDSASYNLTGNIYTELKNKTEGNSTVANEIDSLFAEFYKKKSINQFYNDMLFASKGNLALALKTQELESLNSTSDLLSELLNNSGTAYNDYDILFAFANLLTRNDSSELDEFLKLLSANATGSLKEKLESINLKDLDISTPNDLLLYLYDEADTSDYTQEELFELLHSLSTEVDVNELYFDLIYYSQDSLQQYLLGINLEDEGISSTSELIKHLLEATTIKSFTEFDIVNALDGSQANKINTELVKEILLRNSEGSLQIFIQETDQSEINAIGFKGFIDRLFIHTSDSTYNQTDVVHMLINASGIENTDVFIDSYLGMANQTLKDFITGLDKEQFNSPIEFISYLLEQAGNNNFTSEDVLDALVKLAYLNICQIVEKGSVPEEKSDVNINNVTIPAVGGLLLIVLILLIVRRRRSKK